MPISDKKRAANARWNAKQIQIAIRVPPAARDTIYNHARARGESVTGFLVRAALNQIERDGDAGGDTPSGGD